MRFCIFVQGKCVNSPNLIMFKDLFLSVADKEPIKSNTERT